tara:strand:- start:193 stop:429 length:237 start_codon:yes stop_codon:yes gene_type:complete
MNEVKWNYKTIKPHLIPSIGSLWVRKTQPEKVWHVKEVRCEMNDIVYLVKGGHMIKVRIKTLHENWEEKQIDDVWGEK